MKKSLLALAVMGALSGSVTAQTNVSIYGLIDVGIVRESGAPATASRTKLTSGIANGSRVGFRGTEDLGGGLQAIFTLENGFNADDGSLGQGGLLFGRQAFVGLQSNFGTVRLGRQYTSIDALLGATDPFFNGLEGKANNLFARGYVPRVNNSIMYSTPIFGGFQGDVTYGLGEVAGSSSPGRYVGASFGYSAGPLFVRLAYQDSNTVPAAATATTAAVLAGSDKNTVLGATYNFGPVMLHGAYGLTEADRGGVDTAEFKDVMVGVSVPVGMGKILANFVHRSDDIGTADANFYGLGYLHSLSKRTTLHTSYGYMKSRGAGSRGYTVGSAIEAGSGSRSFEVGVRHTF